ncbi:MAG: hypothetical protein HKN75_00615 [Bacteroidia bacterium]|nr:hypothetical protein [Bacteroidia bacterium]
MKKLLKGLLENTLSFNSEILLKSTEAGNKINEWLSDANYVKVSMGENCNSAWYLKETGNKDASYPYDWIFSSSDIVKHSITDKFQSFLNKDMIVQINDNRAGHSLYHSNLFNHKNPLKSDEDYNYYERAVKRFLDLINDTSKNILFVCTVIQEREKRPGWTNGFNKEYNLPTNQNIDTFTDTMELIKSINKNVKFIFINQFTEGKLNLEIETINDNYLWINFCSKGKNTGVKYLNKIDDKVIKNIYKGMN